MTPHPPPPPTPPHLILRDTVSERALRILLELYFDDCYLRSENLCKNISASKAWFTPDECESERWEGNNIEDKKAFQSNATRLLANSTRYIVNNFENVPEVQDWGPGQNNRYTQLKALLSTLRLRAVII